MIMVKKCEFYNISEGSMEFACSGLSTLDKAFSSLSILHIDDPSFDLLT
jgi:hypothetical protein